VHDMQVKENVALPTAELKVCIRVGERECDAASCVNGKCTTCR